LCSKFIPVAIKQDHLVAWAGPQDMRQVVELLAVKAGSVTRNLGRDKKTMSHGPLSRIGWNAIEPLRLPASIAGESSSTLNGLFQWRLPSDCTDSSVMRPFPQVDARWALVPGFCWSRFRQSDRVQESLARLRFLVGQKRKYGLLVGPAGSGKSSLLEALRRELLAGGTPVAAASGRYSLQPTAHFRLLLEQYGAGYIPAETASESWRKVRDRIRQFGRFGQSTAILIDDADHLADGMLRDTLLLSHAAPGDPDGATMILAVESMTTPRLRDFSRQVDLWTAVQAAPGDSAEHRVNPHWQFARSL
jgi:hypothetical protein